MKKQQEPNGKRQYISRLTFYILSALLLIYTFSSADAQKISVGSKRFTESYVLGEIAKRLLEDAGYRVEHKQGMGGTIIVWGALQNGDIAMYPDYTGTIQETILKSANPMTPEQMRSALAEHGIGMAGELGFNNTYAFAMRRAHSESKNIHRISDLRDHPDLKVGLTHEFLERKDGWEPLSRHYGLQIKPRGMEHALAYVALNNGGIDLMDAYSTDAKLAEYDLTVLEDDLNFFPRYNAVFLYRLDTDPAAINAIRTLEGVIDEGLMRRLNAEAERAKDFTAAVSLYFNEVESRAVEVVSESFVSKTIAMDSATSDARRHFDGNCDCGQHPASAYALAAPEYSAKSSLEYPGSCKLCHRSHCSRYWCRCRCSVSVQRQRLSHSFSTAFCQSFGTPPPVYRTFRHR